MKYWFTLFNFFLIFATANGQSYVQVDMKLLYEKHIYYSFDQGVTASDTGKTWDIGFAVHNQQFGGIFFNEYAERDKRPIIMRLAPTNNFDDVININSVALDTLRNAEVDWNEGAFNSIKNSSDPMDFGWGTHVSGKGIYGNKVFVVSYPDTTYKKLSIDSLDMQGNYYFKFADLNGANLYHDSFNISSYSGKTLAHYSMKKKDFLNLEPNKWDIFITRYNTLANIGGSAYLNYNVTGILSALDVEVAEADNIDPITVDPSNYCYSYEPDIDAIGFDWKSFNLDLFEWELDLDRVYFVKLPNDEIWKLYVIDFEGAFTGIITFQQTYIGNICFPTTASIDNIHGNFNGLLIHPNPTDGWVSIIFDLKESRQAMEVSIVNLLGQPMYKTTIDGNAGLNALNLNNLDLANGQYIFQLRSNEDIISQQLSVVK